MSALFQIDRLPFHMAHFHWTTRSITQPLRHTIRRPNRRRDTHLMLLFRGTRPLIWIVQFKTNQRFRMNDGLFLRVYNCCRPTLRKIYHFFIAQSSHSQIYLFLIQFWSITGYLQTFIKPSSNLHTRIFNRLSWLPRIPHKTQLNQSSFPFRILRLPSLFWGSRTITYT